MHYKKLRYITKRVRCYKLGLELLQSGAKILFITKWVNRYCKVEQVLLSVATLLQSGTTITEKVSISS